MYTRVGNRKVHQNKIPQQVRYFVKKTIYFELDMNHQFLYLQQFSSYLQ